MMSWSKYLQILVLLAIAGFALVVLSGYWHVLALLIIGAVVVLIWRYTQSRNR
jgi:uncharacterized membrane protein